MTHTRIAQVSIDAEALRHNLQRVKTFATDSKVIAVIKANAYGHGVQAAASALSKADAFALATPNEAISLRQSGISKPLIVLQGFSSIEELKALADLDIQAVVHQVSQIDLLEQYVDVKLDIWLKIDTAFKRNYNKPFKDSFFSLVTTILSKGFNPRTSAISSRSKYKLSLFTFRSLS